MSDNILIKPWRNKRVTFHWPFMAIMRGDMQFSHITKTPMDKRLRFVLVDWITRPVGLINIIDFIEFMLPIILYRYQRMVHADRENPRCRLTIFQTQIDRDKVGLLF